MNRVHRRAVLALLASPAAAASLAAEPAPDPWLPIRRLAGEWTGTASGQAGESTVTRRYAWVLGERFLHEVNVSVYPPQEKNRKGERHEHWGLFSYDKARKTLVLRQFHVESFVVTYRRAPAAEPPDALVFESESFENFGSTWRARESYDFPGPDEFVEVFELAPPGKDFQTYSRSRFKRVS